MRSSVLRNVFSAVVLLLVPSVAQAHPGHGGSNGVGWDHWLMDHVFPTAAVAIAIAALLMLAWRSLARNTRR
jgi:hypothetical protein